MKSAYGFYRRCAYGVGQELATVFPKKSWFQFKTLFEVVHTNVKALDAAGGGKC